MCTMVAKQGTRDAVYSHVVVLRPPLFVSGFNLLSISTRLVCNSGCVGGNRPVNALQVWPKYHFALRFYVPLLIV